MWQASNQCRIKRDRILTPAHPIQWKNEKKKEKHIHDRMKYQLKMNQRTFHMKTNVCRFLFGFIYSCVYDRAQSYYTSIVTAIQLVRWYVARTPLLRLRESFRRFASISKCTHFAKKKEIRHDCQKNTHTTKLNEYIEFSVHLNILLYDTTFESL